MSERIKASERIYNFQKLLLEEYVDELTEGQQGKFKRIFPDYGIMKLSEDRLRAAIDLCERQFIKNERNAEAVGEQSNE